MTNAQVETAIASRKQMMAAAEELLRNEANGAILGPDEMAVLEAAGIDDHEKHRRELARMKRVVRWQAEAGTQKDRDALAKQIAKAEKERDEQLPKLRQELKEVIKRLEGQIAEVVESVELPSKKLEAMESACNHLRSDQMLPAHIIQHANMLKSRTKETFHDVTQAETTVKTLPKVIDLCNQARTSKEAERSREFRSYASTRNLFSIHQESQQQVLDQDKLAAHIADLEKQLADAQQIVKGRKDFDEALAEADTVRNYYVR